MASTPTTKSQVQAYRFVLRRMESALVRKDGVMLHDPMGSHKRATVVGVVIACVGMIGFLVWGLFGGKGSVPEPGNVVIGKESGSVFVVTSDERADKRLIPMLNMSSAKLLAMEQGGAQGGGPVEPTTVKEDALADVPRGSSTGMVNAPAYLPDGDDPAAPTWAICDEGDVQDTLNESQVEAKTDVTTTVVGGQQNHGRSLREDESLYVQDQSSGDEYLLYRPHEMADQPNTRTVKAPIDTSDSTVADIYGLNGATPRTISTNMLNAIPRASELSVPDVPDGSISYMNERHESGDVVKRSVPGEPNEYFVLLPSGKQEVSRGAAAVLHASKNNSTNVPDRTGAITEAPAANSSDELDDVSSFPEVVPTPVNFQQASTSCLSWKGRSGGEHDIGVTVNNGSIADGPVKLAQADGPGPNVDKFQLPAGQAAVVRGTSSEAGSGSGPLFLVTDQGVQYGIKDVPTAKGLGIVNNAAGIKDAPSWLMRSLPQGEFLDPAQASFTYDAVEPGEGVNRPPKKDGQAGQQQ